MPTRPGALLGDTSVIITITEALPIMAPARTVMTRVNVGPHRMSPSVSIATRHEKRLAGVQRIRGVRVFGEQVNTGDLIRSDAGKRSGIDPDNKRSGLPVTYLPLRRPCGPDFVPRK